jgi:hypothetical protein
MASYPAAPTTAAAAAPAPPLESEADAIVHLAGGDPARAFEHVERQHAVLIIRTQVLLSLCGIVITVTGFSGRIIAATSAPARASVVAGLFTVLLAAVVAMAGVLRLHWLTQLISTDIRDTLVRCLEQRELKTRRLRQAIVLFVAGFSLYCVAIALMLASARPG